MFDPTATTAAATGGAAGAGGALLSALHRAALGVLRVAFKRYPGQRAAVVQELLPVLSQVPHQ